MSAPAGLLPLPPGLVALTGDEGSGKTTLLRRLAGALGPPLPGGPASTAVLWLDLSLPGVEGQTADAVWATLQARWPGWNAALHADLVEALALSEHRHKQPHMLSTGTRRKVALAGLLAAGAPVTCLDQPFAALDRPSADVVRDFLGDMAGHASRTWIVADYEADASLPWARRIALPAR